MKNLCLLLVLLIGLFGCGGEEDLLPPTSPEIQEADVTLALWQTLPVEENNLQLLVTNTDPIDCINSNMVFDLSSTTTVIDLEIMGFQAPPACQVGDGFVTTTLDLSTVAERFINLTNRGVLNEGKLGITDRAMNLSFLSQDNFLIEESTLQRIPENLVWGYIDLTVDQSVDINMILQQEFPDLFIDANVTDMAPGYYGHFRFDMNPDIDRYVPTEIDGVTDFGQTMLFRLAPDRWSDFSNFIVEASSRFGFSYNIFNAQGEVINN